MGWREGKWNKERKSGKQRAKEFRERKKEFYLTLKNQNAEFQQQISNLKQENARLINLLKINHISFTKGNEIEDSFENKEGFKPFKSPIIDDWGKTNQI